MLRTGQAFTKLVCPHALAKHQAHTIDYYVPRPCALLSNLRVQKA
jgi:hypothetical protein